MGDYYESEIEPIIGLEESDNLKIKCSNKHKMKCNKCGHIDYLLNCPKCGGAMFRYKNPFGKTKNKFGN